MSDLVSKVSSMLRERMRAIECSREMAQKTYAEGLLAEKAAPQAAEAMLAAMDALDLGQQELSADARAVNEALRLERQIADAEAAVQESRDAMAEAERELREVQARWHDPGLEAAHAKVAEAEALKLDREHHLRALKQQLDAVTATAPRVFAGRARPLSARVRRVEQQAKQHASPTPPIDALRLLAVES